MQLGLRKIQEYLEVKEFPVEEVVGVVHQEHQEFLVAVEEVGELGLLELQEHPAAAVVEVVEEVVEEELPTKSPTIEPMLAVPELPIQLFIAPPLEM